MVERLTVPVKVACSTDDVLRCAIAQRHESDCPRIVSAGLRTYTTSAPPLTQSILPPGKYRPGSSVGQCRCWQCRESRACCTPVDPSRNRQHVSGIRPPRAVILPRIISHRSLRTRYHVTRCFGTRCLDPNHLHDTRPGAPLAESPRRVQHSS